MKMKMQADYCLIARCYHKIIFSNAFRLGGTSMIMIEATFMRLVDIVRQTATIKIHGDGRPPTLFVLECHRQIIIGI